MISIGQQIEEVERELAMRKRVYPMMYSKGKLRQSHGEFFEERLRAVLATLCWVRDHADVIKAVAREHGQPPIKSLPGANGEA